MRTCLGIVLATLLLTTACTARGPAGPPPPPSQGHDWPQWPGRARTAISHETGLLQNWPRGGPPLLWKAQGLGEGFSTPAVAGGRIFVMGNRDKTEYVFARDENGGPEVWAAAIGPVRA